jgi:hypothetical protein
VHPGALRDWHRRSSILVLLAARDEPDLAELCNDATARGLRVVRFHEPDLGGALTAAAFEPAAHRRLAHLPLALARQVVGGPSWRGEVRI